MSKRTSPMETTPQRGVKTEDHIEDVGTEGPPPAKRVKDSGAGANGGKAGQDIDPEQMGDVLNAAGVDLREEESLLSKGLVNEPGGLAGARLLHAPKDNDFRSMLLSADYLRDKMSSIASEQGLKLGIDPGPSAGGLSNDPLGLISTSCEEWLSTLLEEAAAYSRHRRLALNPTSNQEQSEVSVALKALVRKDKEAEAKHDALKAKLGLTGQPDEGKDKDENAQKTVNDTARLLTGTIGRKKKFSWMADGASNAGSSAARGSTRRQNADPTRFREIKEENGIVMRDLIPALERKHDGVKKALIRGYAKLRN